MDTTLIIFLISLALNILFILLISLSITRRGGISYLIGRLLAFNTIASEESFSPFYWHRKEQLELLAIAPSDIVFLGDSLTNEGEWAELFGSLQIKNRGISSDTIAGLLKRLDIILEGRPQKIFLLIGINDLIHSQKTAVELKQVYKKILTKIQQSSPNTVVFIQSILPVNQQFFEKKVYEKAIAFNGKLQELASEFSYPYIDLFSHFSNDQNQLDDRYSLDGLHLNGRAYLLWKQVIEPYIMS